jgi:hypothetical protein
MPTHQARKGLWIAKDSKIGMHHGILERILDGKGIFNQHSFQCYIGPKYYGINAFGI